MTEVLQTLIGANDLEAGARYLLDYGNTSWLKLPVLANNVQWFILAARVFGLSKQERFEAALETDSWDLVVSLFDNTIVLTPEVVILHASVAVLGKLVPQLTDEEYTTYNNSIGVFVNNGKSPKPVADDPRFSTELAIESLSDGFGEGYLLIVLTMPKVWADHRVLPSPDFAKKVVEWPLCYGYVPEVIVKAMVVYKTRDATYQRAIFMMNHDKRFNRAMTAYGL